MVTVHAVDDSEIAPYLVMEFVDGETLADRVRRRGPLPFPEVQRLASGVIAGLQAAHQRGLIHWDIKPANVLLDTMSGAAKITDFGIVKAVDDDSGLTMSGTIAGTPEFMSPEQAAAQVGLDARSDLFSLGSLLYFASSGISPFRAESTLSTLLRVSEEQPQRLTDLVPGVPRWFSELVHRLLQKTPADRFQSASEVSDALQVSVADTVNQPDRRPIALIATILAVGAAVLLAIFTTYRGEGEQEPVEVALADGAYVKGTNIRYKSLAEAISAAANGDTIVVHGDQIVTDSVAIKDKSISIRAAEGRLATFELRPRTVATAPAISSDSDLTVEGFRFRWPFDTDSVARGASERATIFSSRGNLSFRRCDFKTLGRHVSVGVGGNATIEQCRFENQKGVGILFSPSVVSRVLVENCVFGGRAALGCTVEGEQTSGSEIDLVRNTFRTKSMLRIIGALAARDAIRVSTRANRFEVSTVLEQTVSRRGRVTNAQRAQFVKQRIRWQQDDHNQYPPNCHFLKLERPSGEILLTIDSNADWRRYWGLSPSVTTVAPLVVGADEDDSNSREINE